MYFYFSYYINVQTFLRDNEKARLMGWLDGYYVFMPIYGG